LTLSLIRLPLFFDSLRVNKFTPTPLLRFTIIAFDNRIKGCNIYSIIFPFYDHIWQYILALAQNIFECFVLKILQNGLSLWQSIVN